MTKIRHSSRLVGAMLGTLAAALLPAVSHAAPFQNGSFEIGTDPGQYQTLVAGDMSITGWTVTFGSVDYIGTYWQAANGARSLDMNGGSQGAIAQTFDTVAGHGYTVTFDLAGNPDGAPTVKTITAQAGSATDIATFDVTGHSRSNMGWTTDSFFFVANGSSTTLTFTGDPSNSAYGPALDNVTVSDVPEPASLTALGVGLVGLGVARRRRR